MLVKLIEEVRARELLYNTKMPEYRDNKKRNEMWREIAAELSMSAQQCKDMWVKLRNCYLNAIKRRRSRCSRRNLAPWKYEEQLVFLLPFIESRDSHSSSTTVVPEELLECLTEDAQMANGDEAAESTTTTTTKTTTTTSAPEEEPPAEGKSQLLARLKLPELDECDVFYLSMSRMVKRLPQTDQVKIRKDLCQLISEAEIRNLERGVAMRQ